jgi:hypothetical protein
MSWKCGNQPTTCVSSPIPSASAIAASLCSRFAWVTTTPLGALVEPDVYCRNATESPARGGCRHASGSPSGPASVATTATRSADPRLSIQSVSCGRCSAVVSTSRMSASSNIPDDRCRLLSSCGNGAGTATTPA